MSQQQLLTLDASLRKKACKCFLTFGCRSCWLIFIQAEKIEAKQKHLRQTLANMEDKLRISRRDPVPTNYVFPEGILFPLVVNIMCAGLMRTITSTK
jgi:hypothetical protein